MIPSEQLKSMLRATKQKAAAIESATLAPPTRLTLSTAIGSEVSSILAPAILEQSVLISLVNGQDVNPESSFG